MFFEDGVGAGPGAAWVWACRWKVVDEVESYEIFLELAAEEGLARAERTFPGANHCFLNADVAESMPAGRSDRILEDVQANPAPEMAADDFRVQKDPLGWFLDHVRSVITRQVSAFLLCDL